MCAVVAVDDIFSLRNDLSSFILISDISVLFYFVLVTAMFMRFPVAFCVVSGMVTSLRTQSEKLYQSFIVLVTFEIS